MSDELARRRVMAKAQERQPANLASDNNIQVWRDRANHCADLYWQARRMLEKAVTELVVNTTLRREIEAWISDRDKKR